MKLKHNKRPFFSIISDKDGFFNNLRVETIFKYTGAYTEYEVVKMGERRGKILQAAPPKYGERMLMVIEDSFAPVPAIFHYDPKNLDI